MTKLAPLCLTLAALPGLGCGTESYTAVGLEEEESPGVVRVCLNMLGSDWDADGCVLSVEGAIDNERLLSGQCHDFVRSDGEFTVYIWDVAPNCAPRAYAASYGTWHYELGDVQISHPDTTRFLVDVECDPRPSELEGLLRLHAHFCPLSCSFSLGGSLAVSIDHEDPLSIPVGCDNSVNQYLELLPADVHTLQVLALPEAAQLCEDWTVFDSSYGSGSGCDNPFSVRVEYGKLTNVDLTVNCPFARFTPGASL